MKTKNYERKTIITHAFCECGGELIYDTCSLFTDLLTGKDKFEHTCQKCGMKVALDARYPDEYEAEVPIDGDF